MTFPRTIEKEAGARAEQLHWEGREGVVNRAIRAVIEGVLAGDIDGRVLAIGGFEVQRIDKDLILLCRDQKIVRRAYTVARSLGINARRYRWGDTIGIFLVKEDKKKANKGGDNGREG